MDKLYKSHDGFFRKLMSERQTAQDYLAAFLPENLKGAIDFETVLGFWSSSRKLAIFWLDETRKPEFSLS